MINLEELLAYPEIAQYMHSVISSVDYYDKVIGGSEITKEQAIAASKIVDPANRPVISTPGKRARVPNGLVVTPKVVKSEGSSSK